MREERIKPSANAWTKAWRSWLEKTNQLSKVVRWILSEQLARQYGWKIGDRVPLGTSIWTTKDGSSTWQFDVVGTFDASAYGAGFPSSYINYDYFDEARAFGTGVVHYYLIGMKDPRQAAQISRKIDSMFENSSNETRTQTEAAAMSSWMKQVAYINLIVTSIMGAVFFTLLLLAGNTMMQAVRERTGEIAVLKTLGFSGQSVLAMVLAESVLLLLIGGAVGLGLASVIGPAVSAGSGGALNLPAAGVASWMTGVGLALVFGLAVGALPALRAMHVNITDALAGRA